MIRGASVIGREHVRLARNNQDAWGFAEHQGASAIVVTDGCSSEKNSEVGAQLAARWLSQWVAQHGASEALNDDFAVRATKAMTAWLYRLAGSFEGELVNAVQQHLLFTFLCAVTFNGRSLVFGIGDGVVVIDDDIIRLDSGPENAPNYIAYRLLEGRAPEVQVHFVGEAKRLSVMTDGFEACAHKVTELISNLGGNPLGLQRKLNVFSETERLSDDATIATLLLEA